MYLSSNTLISIVIYCCFLILNFPAMSYSNPIDIFDIPWKSVNHFQKGLVQAEWPVLYKIALKTEYKIKVELADDYRSLKGYQEVLYTNNESITLNKIYFRLFPNMNGGAMKVSQILVKNQAISGKITQKSTVLKVKLPNPLLPGSQILIRMHFDLTYPASLSGNYGQFAYYKNILVSANFFPIIPAYNHQGWNIELPPTYSDYVVTDAAMFTVQITAPSKFVIAASGSRIENHKKNETSTSTYVIGPARDFYFAGSEYFERVIKESDGVSVESYAFKKNEQGAEFVADLGLKTLDYMNDKIGAYPYKNFKIVSVPTMAMGIEYPGITAVSQQFYNLNQIFSGLPGFVYLRTTIVHETIHQWFYNVVGNDQVDEPWLDEAITQYCTWRYFHDKEKQQSANGLLQFYRNRLSSVSDSSLPLGLPAYQYSPNNYAPIIYSKGPLFFIKLEKIISRKRFDLFLKQYFKQYKWSISSGSDLQRVAEETCSCSLDSVFNEWVYP